MSLPSTHHYYNRNMIVNCSNRSRHFETHSRRVRVDEEQLQCACCGRGCVSRHTRFSPSTCWLDSGGGVSGRFEGSIVVATDMLKP